MIGAELNAFFNRVRKYGELIKFSHTVFALPFALAAVMLAHRSRPVSISTLGWILVAMAAARSAAMGFNRYVDYEYDRRNPRTRNRPLVAGFIDRRSVLFFIIFSSAIFFLAAAMLGRVCLLLAPPVLIVLFFYSYTKRFTSLSHLFLGFAIGLAPLGAWVAVTGGLDLRIFPLSLALMSYIAGFDILYACQDVTFDRCEKLFSMPACWGIKLALRISSWLHIVTFLALLSLYPLFQLGSIYLLFLLFISGLLYLEHRLVRPDNFNHVNLAFFHLNSVVSILLFLAVGLDTWVS